ncbi:hypothetical protein U9M48_029810 [Paspalum notatum var. saurae]|uniref:Uncharacterized protein n=1 Tax=Paspalum notatum var. saurae TaxID=547442 RepID=A0AAQ3X2M6_PASNO
MDPNIKLLADELHKRFDDLDLKWEQRLLDAELRLGARIDNLGERHQVRIDGLEAQHGERLNLVDSLLVYQGDRIDRAHNLSALHDERLSRLEGAALAFDDWCPRLEALIDDIKWEMHKCASAGERLAAERPSSGRGILPLPKSALERPPAPNYYADGPNGHYLPPHNRDDGFGLVFTISHHPVKGAYNPPYPPPPPPPNLVTARWSSPQFGAGSSGKLPKLQFPSFDGDNPKLWVSRCEDYFDLYHVDPQLWVRVAAMHFSGAAARWSMSVESRLRSASWSQFGQLLLERFGRNQQEQLIRQLYRFSQTGSVQDYIDSFVSLVDQLVAYGPNTDPLYYTTRFIDGLRPDIRAAVLIQRPKDLDSACTLALLQEEVSAQASRREFRKTDPGGGWKPAVRGPSPLPLPPGVDKQVPTAADKTSPEQVRSNADKFSALRAYRRAKGLCDRCAEKWHPGHRCAASIQLHVVEELFELFQQDEAVSPPSSPPHSSEHVCLALSAAAVSGSASARTLKLIGFLQSRQLKILVDSSSSSSFLGETIARDLSGVSQLVQPVAVQVANGAQIWCDSVIPNAVWSVHNYEFTTDLRIIPLQHYDLIVGMDWLESFSPMNVHWRHKWMQIPYQGSVVLIQGEDAVPPAKVLVQVCNATWEQQLSSVSNSVPPEISALLSEYTPLFAPVDGLPLVRGCEHSIPLIPGAKPVSVRPYRYPPALKTEIEQQVQDLLSKGLIQPSSSPFSSPMLLVKKKDGSWRPVVDYRYLNALTIRGKFPIPVFDELMDELAGSSWFSSLDLNSGFHQIRLKPGEEPKTAFQTHFGHYEFRVMSFGLCGAPGTFQGAMNTTLQPLLRKCVLVFFDDILIYSKSYDEHVRDIRAVLELLSKDKWQIKLSKCSFAQRQLAYLGHVISAEGISTDQSKVDAVSAWPVPTNAKELRGFLGLAGYYRKFVRHFAILARPLSDLLKKHALFIWTPDHQAAFDALKMALSSAPVLAMPDFSRPFCIETDACNSGVGAVLLQQGHPLAYISKPLEPVWSTAIVQGYSSDPHALDLITRLSVDPSSVPHFSLSGGLLRYKGLPLSSGKNCILVVVDKFTKYGHFIALAHPFTAASVATVFFDHIYRLHGLPESIVSDRDRVFTAHFWKELFRLAGVSLRMSSSYHPQTDGQTERVNQCLETFLRCYIHACPSRWSKWLGSAEYWYNTSFHSAIGRSPFEALYGYSPRSLGVSSNDVREHPDLSDWLKDKELMNRLL